MIEARGLSKRYGEKIAVNNLSFDVEPGKVTGFLGPNGAGKTTTMRLMLGLDYPDAGGVTIDGKQYVTMANPCSTSRSTGWIPRASCGSAT
jgi:ABC-2 type transport system ATP-binding protein